MAAACSTSHVTVEGRFARLGLAHSVLISLLLLGVGIYIAPRSRKRRYSRHRDQAAALKAPAIEPAPSPRNFFVVIGAASPRTSRLFVPVFGLGYVINTST